MYLQNRNLTFKLQEVGDGRTSFHEKETDSRGRFVGQKSWSLQKVSVIKRTEKAGEVGAVQGYEKINKIQSANLDGSQLKTTTQT